MADKTPPYGFCECPNASGMCCGGMGPAAYEVTREGKQLKLCTRCDLTADRPTRRLLLTKEDSADIFLTFDALGFFCILNELQ